MKFSLIKNKNNFFNIFIMTLILILLIIIYYIYIKSKNNYEYFIDITGSNPNNEKTEWNNFKIDIPNIEIPKIIIPDFSDIPLISSASRSSASRSLSSKSSSSTSSASTSSASTSSASTSSALTSSALTSSASTSSASTSSALTSSALTSSASTSSSSTSSASTSSPSRKKICNLSSRNLLSSSSSISPSNNEYTKRTPCLNKTDDFDTWCRYYSNKKRPDGYNVNSIGLKELLIGSDGGCYANGISDDSKAVGVCGYNYTEEVKKLTRPNEKVDYNIFTDCKYMNTTNYTRECANLLNINENNAFADQITSYDCNPGFGRAKCLNNSDRMIYNNNFGNLYGMNTTQTKLKDGCICTS